MLTETVESLGCFWGVGGGVRGSFKGIYRDPRLPLKGAIGFRGLGFKFKGVGFRALD